MLKIMANENMDEWRMAPGIAMETVSATKKFLEERPEELKKLGQVKKSSPVGEEFIARFLGWPGTRVQRALEDLKSIASGEIERGAIEMMPTQSASEKLRKTVKSISKTQPVTPEMQVRAA